MSAPREPARFVVAAPRLVQQTVDPLSGVTFEVISARPSQQSSDVPADRRDLGVIEQGGQHDVPRQPRMERCGRRGPSTPQRCRCGATSARFRRCNTDSSAGSSAPVARWRRYRLPDATAPPPRPHGLPSDRRARMPWRVTLRRRTLADPLRAVTTSFRDRDLHRFAAGRRRPRSVHVKPRTSLRPAPTLTGWRTPKPTRRELGLSDPASAHGGHGQEYQGEDLHHSDHDDQGEGGVFVEVSGQRRGGPGSRGPSRC